MYVNATIRFARRFRLALLVALVVALGLYIPARGQSEAVISAPQPVAISGPQFAVTAGLPPVALGPYVQNVGATNAVICWATLSGEVTIDPPTKNDARFREYQVHSLVLRGLTPGTNYTYRVPGDPSDGAGCTFTTVPKKEQPFSFCVVSDTQNRGNKAHASIVERLLADKPDLLFNVGDLVSDGRSFDDWEEFFRVQGPLLRSVPCYAVLGNHECDSSLYFQFFALPGNERYYSFNRGTAHFVVLDSPGGRMPDDNQAITKAEQERFTKREQRKWQQQMEWFKEDLAAHQDAKYVFVFFHYPVYSLMAKRVAANDEFRARFGTVFQDHRVTAVFSGHDHHYHREVAGGVHFLDGGAAGGTARPLDGSPRPETVKQIAVACFTRVEIGRDRAQVRVIDVAGQTVDEFELFPRSRPTTRPE